MGLFKNVFNKKDDVRSTSKGTGNAPNLIMTFNQLPIINYRLIAQKIQSIEPINGRVEVIPDSGRDREPGLMAIITFLDHKIKLIGIEDVLSDDILDYTVNCSNWTDEEKMYIASHRSYIICEYEGSCKNPTEIYIALYKVIYAFIREGLKGVVNVDAWTCQPVNIVNNLMAKDMLFVARNHPLLTMWTNYIQLNTRKGTWIFTKGYHVFGLCDLAYLGDISEVDEINEMFADIFHYGHDNNMKFHPEQTLKLNNGRLIRFKKVEEEKELLEGPNGTLEITILNKSYMK